MTRGEKVCAFISRYCVVPEGDLIGKPLVLEDFQRKFILDIYDNPHGTDTAILCMARKNAKTALIACLVLAHLVGPEAKQNSRIISGAMSREQAGEVYNLASKMVMLNPALGKVIRLIPSLKKMVGLKMGVEYQATSADSKTAHGKSPIFAIIDEIGQVTGPRSDFVDAITTAQGAYSEPLLVYISTQAQSDTDLFSLIIDDAKTNKPPKTVCHVYEADKDCDIMDETQWKKANPALGLFRSIDDMRKQAQKAARMPSFENTFRQLHLNQRVTTSSPFISRSVWEACAGVPFPLSECSEIFAGLDLSKRTDLTALVLLGYHEATQTWNAHTHAWAPEEGIHDRGRRDRVPYDLWAKAGHLHTTPGSTVNYEHMMHELKEIVPSNIICIGFDSWNMPEFRREMEKAGADFPMEEVRQGFKTFSPSLSTLEEMILNKTLRHGNHPVLNMCAANAAITSDPAGNRKLDKMKATGRIDAFVALTMAAGIAKVKHSHVNIDEILDNRLVL